MKNYGKWIGGGLGFAIGGPIGALLGFAVGAMIDNTSTELGSTEQVMTRSRRTTSGDFTISLIVLSAAIMRADGKVLRSELNYVKAFFVRQFGESRAADHLSTLREILKQPFDLRSVSYQIRDNMEHPLRLQLLHYLFGLAASDGAIDQTESRTLEDIARYMGISQKDFESIRAMFGNDIGSAYKILEISEDAAEADIKKAYRKMALKYHPDKVGSVGEEFQKAAREKFESVQRAYETIKKHKGIK